MPRPLENTGLYFEDGTKKTRVTDDPKILMGWIEGTWWYKYSWWVIPLTVLLLTFLTCRTYKSYTNPVLSPSDSPPPRVERQAPPRDYDIEVVPIPVPVPDPGPALTPPPSPPKAEVTETEKRIYRVRVMPR